MNASRKRIWDKSGGRCWYCGEELPEKGWHADHMEPIQRKLQFSESKGLHTTNECYHPERDNEENKVPSCRSCNVQKHSMTIEQFRAAIQGYVNSLNNYSTQYAVAKRYGLVTETQQPVIFYFERQRLG